MFVKPVFIKLILGAFIISGGFLYYDSRKFPSLSPSLSDQFKPLVPIQLDYPNGVLEKKSFKKIDSKIFFLDSLNGWAICSKNKLCSTTDGGKTWKVFSYFKIDDDVQRISSIIFLNSKKGFCIIDSWANKRHYSIFLTKDGGKNWSKVFEIDSPISSLSFSDDKNGIILSRWSPIYTSSNRGVSWERLEKRTSDEEDLSALKEGLKYSVAVSNNEFWGYGGGIWHSENGGKRWQKIIDIGDTDGGVFSSSFPKPDYGWIAGHKSQLWKLSEGKVWTKQEISENVLKAERDKLTFYRIDFISEKEGWISCHNLYPGESIEKLLYTQDGGLNWKLVFESPNQFQEIRFLTSKHGFALNDNSELLETQDSGINWKKVE